MTYRLVPMQGFGGLNLRDGPDAVGISEAIDLLNVEFSERGAVRQRLGYGELTTTLLTNVPDSITSFYKVDGTRRLIVGQGNRLTAIGTDGTVQGSEYTTTTASPHFFSRFGGPTIQAVYIANGTDQVKRYDTTGGFTAPAGLSGQTGRHLAVQSPDNRLVVAGEAGTTAGNNPSSVNFSDAGAPETFTAANYVDITPGDGEAIMGVCAWREYVFVFKESKFAVFYGNSVSSTGTPVFNYRLVDSGIGLASPRALAVAEEGVYFLDRKGVYRTAGGPPELVSDVLDPFFHGAPSVYYRSGALSHANITKAAMTVWENRIYLSVPTGSSTVNDRVLVFSPRLHWWSLYDLPVACMVPFRVTTGSPELAFGYSSGDKHLGRHGFSTFTADDMEPAATGGTAITSRWRGGWQDMGTPQEKTVRESQLWGSGTVTCTLTANFRGAGGLSQVIELGGSGESWDGFTWEDGSQWGPSTTIREQMMRKALPGAVFSTELSNGTINTTFSVHRLSHHLREAREPDTVAV